MSEQFPPLLDFYGAADSGGPGMRLIGIDAEEPAQPPYRPFGLSLPAEEGGPSRDALYVEADGSVRADWPLMEAYAAEFGIDLGNASTQDFAVRCFVNALLAVRDGRVSQMNGSAFDAAPIERLSSGWEHLPDVTRPEPKTMPARALTGRAAPIGLRVP